MRSRALILGAASLFISAAAFSHSAPNSVVSLDFDSGEVHAEFFVPVSELAYATAAERPGEEFPAYLLRHVSARTLAGVPWKVDFRNVHHASSDGHDYWVAALVLRPPRGTSSRDLVLVDDVVTHEVRNHVVTVLARSDAAAPAGIAGSRLLGVLQYPARSLTIHLARAP
jgi:hypothetical protein